MLSLAPSADMVALVQVATVLPIVLFSLPAGAAADVWDRRRVMIIAQLLMLTVSALLAGLAWHGLVTPWSLLAITFAIGSGGALYGPAWQSSVSEQVPRKDLPAAVSLNSVAFNLARAVGPALGGVLVASAGARAAFLVNAISYLGLIIVLAGWKRPPRPNQLPPEGMVQAMVAGLRFARLSQSIQTVLVRSAVFGFFAAALWALIPLVARELLHGGAATYGFLLAAFGGGAVAGAFVGAEVRSRYSVEVTVVAASAAFAGATLVVAFSVYVVATLAALIVAGAAWVIALSTFNVTVQLRAPRWVVGRAMAIYQAGVFAGLALGAWLWGILAEQHGLFMGLAAPALGLGLTVLLGRVLPMPSSSTADLETPQADLNSPHGLEIKPDSGPVVASIEYRLANEDLLAFGKHAQSLGRMRRRNGARRWLLLNDAEKPEVWIERFETATWLDYLRVRDRMTLADRQIEAQALSLHAGSEPPATRLLLAHLPEEPGFHVGHATHAMLDANLSLPIRTGRKHGDPHQRGIGRPRR